MTLLAVAPGPFGLGVEGPADDWRARPGAPENSRHGKRQVGVRCDHEVTDLGNALAATYRTDAHLVAYVMRAPDGAPLSFQPRLRKAGLPWVLELGYSVALGCLFADVDNPLHEPWNPSHEALARSHIARLPPTCGYYASAHGWRVVQPLSRPVPIDDAEGVISTWLGELQALGIPVDLSCTDWTRYFRLPRVRRQGRPAVPLFEDYRLMRPIDPAPLAGGRLSRAVGPATGRASSSPLGRAFAAAGWLGAELGRGKVIAVCPWSAEHSTGRPGDSSTVILAPTAAEPAGRFHCSHAHCRRRTLGDVRRVLPAPARAVLLQHLPPEPAALAPAAPTVPAVSADDARAQLEGAFRSAPPGVSLVVAGCGTGKTEAALVVAGERSATPYASATAKGARAPLHSKTVISVPRNDLAIEVADRARAKGIAVRRIFGALSVDGPGGCHFQDAGKALASGGLSVPRLLCDGCEHYDGCKAREGTEGPDDARVIVGSHALLPQLVALAGGTGLRVIDEPPALLEHRVLTAQDLEDAVKGLEDFEPRYAAALAVSLMTIAAWIAVGPLDEPGELSRGVAKVDPKLMESAFQATGATDPVEAARAAFEPGHKGTAPDVKRRSVSGSRGLAAWARKIGQTARAAGLVHLGLTAKPGAVKARLEERGGGRVLVITAPNQRLLDALRSDGATVIADANGRVHLPIYERAVGYAPPVVEVRVEGVAVERTVRRTRATRAAWTPGGELQIGPGLVRAVAAAVTWALAAGGAPRLAIVTLRPLAAALRAALGEDVAPSAAVPAAVLDQARREFGPILRRLPVRPDVGHYGAIRGLDHWRGHDALVTLGDPWPQLGDVQLEADLLELGSWEERGRALAAAELEQAHGRLRTVHRVRPARALHVGAVVPAGWEGRCTVEELGAARPAAEMGPAALQEAVERLGGQGRAAAALGCGERALRYYLTGARAIPEDVAARIAGLTA